MGPQSRSSLLTQPLTQASPIHSPPVSPGVLEARGRKKGRTGWPCPACSRLPLPAQGHTLEARNSIWSSDLLCLTHTVFFKNMSQRLKIRSFRIKSTSTSSRLRMGAQAT